MSRASSNRLVSKRSTPRKLLVQPFEELGRGECEISHLHVISPYKTCKTMIIKRLREFNRLRGSRDQSVVPLRSRQ
jgi:hypothetical protein